MKTQTTAARSRRWRSMAWSLVVILVLAVALPSIGYLSASQQSFGTQPDFNEDRVTNPRSDMWRDARFGEGGFTTQTGPYVTNTMISNVGENWRQIRSGPLKSYGGGLLIVAILLISLFGTLMGRIRIEGGRSGMTVQRWKGYERFLHWSTAISFVVLAITGLSLLFGRTVLIPLFGHTGFAAYAQLSMTVHNYIGPLFSIGILLMIVLWAKDNIPNKTDLQWFKQGGGIVGDGHPSAGKMNGGEKVWFWAGIFVLGLVVITSGFILNFPNLEFQTREIMAWSQIVHAVASIFWISFFFGHAFIGSLGTQGALQGMTTGSVDTNWARQHHDLWYAELMAKGVKPVPAASLRHGASSDDVGHVPGSAKAPGH